MRAAESQGLDGVGDTWKVRLNLATMLQDSAPAEADACAESERVESELSECARRLLVGSKDCKKR